MPPPPRPAPAPPPSPSPTHSGSLPAAAASPPRPAPPRHDSRAIHEPASHAPTTSLVYIIRLCVLVCTSDATAGQEGARRLLGPRDDQVALRRRLGVEPRAGAYAGGRTAGSARDPAGKPPPISVPPLLEPTARRQDDATAQRGACLICTDAAPGWCVFRCLLPGGWRSTIFWN